jgi:hypothetical protein
LSPEVPAIREVGDASAVRELDPNAKRPLRQALIRIGDVLLVEQPLCLDLAKVAARGYQFERHTRRVGGHMSECDDRLV